MKSIFVCNFEGFHDPFHHHHFGGFNDGHYAYEHHEHHFGAPVAHHVVSPVVHAPYVVQPGTFTQFSFFFHPNRKNYCFK